MALPNRRKTRVLTVKSASYITPHMVRVTLTGDDLSDFPDHMEGAHCKLAFPREGEDLASFTAFHQAILPKKKVHPVRTYTVRSFRREGLELDIDFVAHGDSGPATLWAQAAKPGDFLAFMGPGPVKVTDFYADWYLVAADMSALPVAAATLEAMPRSAKGVAVFEVHSLDDRQDIDLPEGIDVHWLVQDDPHASSTAQLDFVQDLDWPEGRIQTCIAGESGLIRQLRQLVQVDRGVDRKDAYISGYWKVGLVEDEHQEAKRAGADG